VARPLQLDVRRVGGTAVEVELSLDVPSDLAYVGEAVDLVARHCPAGILSHRRLLFNLRTALAEALANAILYGNGEDPEKRVSVRVETGRDLVRLHVTDEGTGFDRTHLPDPTRPENLEREDGRGLFVMRHLVDQITFNDKGNAVCLTLRAR
jgi:serine/threonine-protein kinase RsbW